MQVTVKYPRWHATLDRVWEQTFHVDYEHNPVDTLEHLFAGFGNHSEIHSPVWQAARVRSMSMGDFVKVGEQWYQCAGGGWIRVTQKRVDEVMAMPAYDYWSDNALR